MRPLIKLAQFVVAVLAAFSFSPAGALVLPTGFVTEHIVQHPFAGDPTAFARLPDGRFLLIERTTANVRLAAVGALNGTLIHTIPNVQAAGFEQGLLGITVDPEWPTRPYLYFQYTHTVGKVYLTMYTASGDLTNPASTNITLASPFHVLADLPDNLNFHNGGTIRFAPDGTLLSCVGDDGAPCMAQNLAVLVGKILRLDVSQMPGVGSGPPPKADITPIDNPFSGPGDNERLVYAWGLRNPFRFTIDSATGDVMIGDVGENAREEIDYLPKLLPGLNYGWPVREGDQPGCCPTCPPGSAFTEPEYVYAHGVTPQAVIAGSVVRTPLAAAAFDFPAEYDGSFFFCEFYDGWIRRLVNTGSGWEIAPPVPGQPDANNWATGLPFIADMQLAPDGAIYYVVMVGGARGIYRLRSSVPVDAPVIADAAKTAALVTVQPAPLRAGGTTEIRWSGTTGRVTLGIFDASGRRVRTLLRGDARTAGSVAWDGRANGGGALPSGVYFVRLESDGGEGSSAKVVLFR